MEHGFFRSLLDLSFTSFITTKIIKLVYVVTLVLVALWAVVLVALAFREDTVYGVLALLIGAPLGALLCIVLTRLWLEIVIQVFRITELLRDQNHMQRAAFSEAGWLAAQSSAAQPTSTVSECPQCGAPPTPGAAFCRNCGHQFA